MINGVPGLVVVLPGLAYVLPGPITNEGPSIKVSRPCSDHFAAAGIWRGREEI